LNEYFSKVFSKNEKWTFLKMSKNENPKKLFGKICKNRVVTKMLSLPK
jgi:hypothetical protein